MTNPEKEQSSGQSLLRFLLAAFLFVLVLAMYFHTNDPTGDIKRLMTGWAAGLLGTGWLVATRWYKFPQRRPAIFLELLLAFLFLFAVATARSDFFSISIIQLTTFFALFILYLMASQVFHTPLQVRSLLRVFCVAVALSSLYGFLQGAGYDPFPWGNRQSDVYTNLPATFGNPNYAAHALVLAIIMSLYLAATGSRLNLIFLAIFAVHLNKTDQRAGLVALAAAAALVLIAKGIGRVVKKPLTGAALSLVVFALVGMVGTAGVMGLSKARTGTLFPLDVSLLIRYQSYVSATNMALDAPVFGHGPGVYGASYARYWTPFEQEWFAQENRMNAHVHNDLLELTIDGGLPVAGLYLAMLVFGMAYGLFMALTPSTKERQYLGYTFAALFCAFFVDGLFGFNLRVPVTAAVIFILMGLLDGLSSGPLSRKRAEAKPSQGENDLSLVWRVACFAALVVTVIFHSRVFASEYMMRRAQRAPNYSLARAQYNKGEQFAPWNLQFARRLAALSIGENNKAQAIKEYERALTKNPYYILTITELAQTKLLMVQDRLAETTLENLVDTLTKLEDSMLDAERALDLCPVLPAADEIIGRAASIAAATLTAAVGQQDDSRLDAYWDRAESHLMRALENGATQPHRLNLVLAKLNLDRGKIKEAEDAFVRGVQIDPTGQEVWPSYLAFIGQYGRHDRARNALYDQIDREKSKDMVNFTILTANYLWLAEVLDTYYDDPLAVEKAYLDVVGFNPKEPAPWSQFARYAYSQDRTDVFERAIAQSCARLELENQQPLPQLAIANAIIQQGKNALEQASIALLTNIRRHPSTERMSAAQTYRWTAQLLYDAAQPLTPDDPALCPAYLNLGIIFSGLNDFDISDRFFGAAMTCLAESQRGTLLVYWADTLVRRDRSPEAVSLLERGIREDANDLEVRHALAMALKKVGRLEDARDTYDFLLLQADLAPQARAMFEYERAAL